MAYILGLILVFMLGGGIGAWAMFDWLRFRGQLSTFRQSSEEFTKAVIEQMLEDYDRSSAVHLTTINHVPDMEDSA